MPERLRRSVDSHLRNAVESAPSGLLMTDAAGRIVLVNRELERMFGYSREELLGQPIERLVPARFAGAHAGYRGGFVGDPQVRPMGAGRELFGLRKDGTEVPVEIGLTPLPTEDGLLILGTIVDISARKALEEEQRSLTERLRQAQKMEAIGTLAGGIAHDFNNVLGGILGYAELIAQQVEHDTGLSADVAEVVAAALRGRLLVERILAFSRREPPHPTPVDLREVVREVQHLLRATIPANITLRVQMQPDVPRVLADVTSVHQVLMNLATNAAQSMPGGGTLDFTVQPLYVRDSIARANPDLREGPHLALGVRDSGSGMDAETRTRAFEPFFTTKPAGSGTGLGLATVHRIMRDHAGSVMLESEPGAGTHVRCLFPVLANEASADGAAGEALRPALRGRGERILFVDDERMLLEVGRRRLGSIGYEVTVTASPAEALARLRADPQGVDLVITDHSMPGMTGRELAVAIGALRPGLPVILLSGFIDFDSRESIAQDNVRLVLQKPVLLDELARACRIALG